MNKIFKVVLFCYTSSFLPSIMIQITNGHYPIDNTGVATALTASIYSLLLFLFNFPHCSWKCMYICNKSHIHSDNFNAFFGFMCQFFLSGSFLWVLPNLWIREACNIVIFIYILFSLTSKHRDNPLKRGITLYME